MRSPFLARLVGDFTRAGDLYYRRGRLAKAAEMYARGGSFEQAARLFVELGLEDRAVDFFVQGGNHLRAGELLAAAGHHAAAVREFEQAGAYREAAQSSLRLKQYLRAGHLFERAGYAARAIQCFEKGGELPEALRVLEEESQRLETRYQSTAQPELRDERRQVEAKRAALLAQLGRPAEAAAVYMELGETARAAEHLEAAGEYDGAAEAWNQAGRPERAAALLDRASGLDPTLRARILLQCGRHREAAEQYAKAGVMAEAAEAFEAAGELERAARFWEQAADHEQAAGLYYRLELWRDAARNFERAGKQREAAEAYSRVPDPAAAARCYLAEDPLRAAELFLESGDEAAASLALQTMDQDHPHFMTATLRLVPLLLEEGLAQGALHRLRLLPEESSTGSLAVDRLYWLGRCHEAAGELRAAQAAYQKAVALRRDHRDLEERLAAVSKEVLARGGTGTLTGATVSPDETTATGGPFGRGHLLADRYEILGELGRGGMGRVYKARDRELGETVAIKTLRSYGEEAAAERLLREVQISRRITHPNVVRVYDMGRFPGGVFVTMELLEGEQLDRVIRERAPLEPERVKSIVLQVLHGLQAAHRLRIVHRDLKPANVFLTEGGVKILDFGIARSEEHDLDLTQTGQILGSPKYMSPEQIRGDSLDARSDLYSLGVLTYALLIGEEPFTGTTPSSIALKHLHSPPPDVRSERPELRLGWGELLDRLLAKEPGERYASTGEALAAVAQLDL